VLTTLALLLPAVAMTGMPALLDVHKPAHERKRQC
jgi:hypothetical protein